MDRRNTYHGQTVTEAQLDQLFDDCEDAEHNLAIESQTAQGINSGTPSSDVFGGILKGLTVTINGGDTSKVDVAVGQARDQLGRRIATPSIATVSMTKTGDTDEGEVAAAAGDGSLMTSLCASGNRIIATLSVVYDENLANPQVDAVGNTVYYDVTESFHFNIKAGATDFSHPPASAPDRAALADGYVALCDLVISNTAGTIAVVAIVNTTDEWHALANGYAELSGRRASWLAVELSDEFDSGDVGDAVRANSAREALYHLARQVNCGALLSERVEAASALRFKRNRYGHPTRAHEFFDDFVYCNDQIDLTNDYMGPWTLSALGGGGIGLGQEYVKASTAETLGGLVDLLHRQNAGYGISIVSPYAWNLGAAPWTIGMFRFKAFSSDTDTSYRIGFLHSAGTGKVVVEGNASTGNFVYCTGTSGSAGTVVSLGASLSDDVWHTIKFLCADSTDVYFQLDAGSWTLVQTAGGTDPLLSGGYAIEMRAWATLGGGPATGGIRVDQAFAGDAQIHTDLY